MLSLGTKEKYLAFIVHKFFISVHQFNMSISLLLFMGNSKVHELNMLLAMALAGLRKRGIPNIISDVLKMKLLADKLYPRKVTQKLHSDDEVIHK